MGKCSAKDKEDPVTGSENYGTFHITPWDISLLGNISWDKDRLERLVKISEKSTSACYKETGGRLSGPRV